MQLEMTEGEGVDCGDQIALIIENGDNRFDENRFKYISSMYERGMKQRSPVSSILMSKVQTLLVSYQSELSLAEENSMALARRIKMSFPESSNEVDLLGDNYNVKALIKIEERLIRASGVGVLGTLTNILLQEGEFVDSQSNPSFLELLQSQENEVVKEFSGNETCTRPKKRELKSTRIFRESQEKLNSEKLVRQAIKEGPVNPGPINPHMLAIRSLSTMQSLSPKYLKRFLSYIDTVFWLEQASEDLKPKTESKRTLTDKSKS